MNTQAFMSYTDAIKTLKDSPMFNLSLSSKELFHSNFLYWIWKVDSNCFKGIIEALLGEPNLNWGNDWVVSREYKNFDLCVKDRSNEDLENDDSQGLAKKPKIYFVLENKVKSIPYKAQLDKYVKKVNEHHGKNKKMQVDTKYLLLSLPSGFPDEESIRQEGIWVIATYQQYLDAINNLAKLQGYKEDILTDYCRFVGALLYVYNTWNNNCYQSNSPLLDTQYIADAEELRIHDLYHKSKYAQICAGLQARIQSDIQGKVDIIENDDKKIISALLPPNSGKKLIAFGYGYTNGQPFVDVKVAFHDGHHPIICIIQAQGGWYRHGIIMNHSKLSKYYGTKDQRIWNYLEKNNVTPIGGNIICVNGHEWMRFENFASGDVGKMNSLSNIKSVIDDNGRDIVDTNDLYPNCKSRKDSQPYGKYAGDNSNIGMIYQYRKLASSVTVGQLIDYIVKDVKRLI